MPSSLSCPVMEGCSIQVPKTAPQKEVCVHRKGLAERPRGLSLGERTGTHRYRLLYLGWDPGLRAALLVPSPHLLSRPKVSKPNLRSWFSKPPTRFREFWPLSVSVDGCRCLRCLRCLFHPEDVAIPRVTQKDPSARVRPLGLKMRGKNLASGAHHPHTSAEQIDSETCRLK